MIENNPMNNLESRNRIKKTKLEKYGASNYNNIEKQSKTTMTRYGVPYTILLGKSNGKRISNGQRELFEKIQVKHKDAILEHWLADIQKSVDIFIPSLKKIIEYNGEYWHCNPKKCPPDFYNSQTHLTALETWKLNKKREFEIMKAGYNLEIVWENSDKVWK